MNLEKRRKQLFQHLDSVLEVSQKKFSTNNRRCYERMKWGRLIVQAVNSYGKLLESYELEQMARDIEAIKKKVGLN